MLNANTIIAIANRSLVLSEAEVDQATHRAFQVAIESQKITDVVAAELVVYLESDGSALTAHRQAVIDDMIAAGYWPSDHDVLALMARDGGSFVSALSEAWRRADLENKAKLLATFGHYWRDYTEAARLELARRKAPKS